MKFLQDLLDIEETKKLNISEGILEYSVNGSDQASDAFHDLTKVMMKSLKQSLKQKGSSYNTPGTLNVAMIFNEYLTLFAKENEFKDLGRIILGTLNDSVNELEGEDSDGDNKDYLNVLKSNIKRLKSFIAK